MTMSAFISKRIIWKPHKLSQLIGVKHNGLFSMSCRRFSTPNIQIGGGYLQTGHKKEPEKGVRILVTGAAGQIGSELVPYLQTRYGVDNVIASDIKQQMQMSNISGPFVYADVQSYDTLARICLEQRVDWVIHLAALLSAIGEQNPQLAIKVNTRGIENILELARQNDLRVYSPSSIAAFGPETPKDNTPQVTIMRPTTVYGISKVYNELLGEYYHQRFGVDFRSLRYPGIISGKTMASGGTTDYAVEIFHEAILHKKYTCFLEKDTPLPMMYMPDTLKATVDLMESPEENLTQRSYNLTSMTFTPEAIADIIREEIPDFEMIYAPDFRQSIAETWPRSIDDSVARRDWGWKPDYNLKEMASDIFRILREQYKTET